MSPRRAALATWRLILDVWPLSLFLLTLVVTAAIDHRQVAINTADLRETRTQIDTLRESLRDDLRALRLSSCARDSNATVRELLRCPSTLHP